MRPSSVLRLIVIVAGLLSSGILAADDAPFGPQSPSYGTSDLTYLRLTGLDVFPYGGGGYKPSHNIGRYPVADTMMMAPLHLPQGSSIDYLEIQFCDLADPQDIHLQLFECTPSGGCVNSVVINSFANPGCSSISTRGMAYPVNSVSSTLSLWAEFQSVNDPNLVLTGAVVGYRLQVSPAPATATFNDVPTNHPFFQYIEALAASGITGGCGGGNFCPNNPVTRGQMAAFLAKALGLHWPN